MRLNAEAFAPGLHHRHGRGWVLASWFVPVASLWIPKQITNDIWAASDPAAGPVDPYGRRGKGTRRGVLNAWWTFWVFDLLLQVPLTMMPSWEETDSAQEARAAVVVTLVENVAMIAAAVLAIIMVQRLTAMQERRGGTSYGAPVAAPPGGY